jgi:pimeloyl-ACP methyl ester carboxylesterase
MKILHRFVWSVLLSVFAVLNSTPATAPQAKLVASNVEVVTLKNTGHWLMVENHGETMNALLKFL